MQRFKHRARQLRGQQTSAEARLWQALRNRNLASWKFRRQHSIDK
jgi:very-short-patch-repair endonuclease